MEYLRNHSPGGMAALRADGGGAHMPRGYPFRAFVPKARGAVLGRKMRQGPSADKAKRGSHLHEENLSHRVIASNVGLSKNTVMEIVRRQATVA